MLAKCNCNNCSGHLEFDSAAAGTTITCPHCGLDTVLFVPPASQPPLPVPPVSENRTGTPPSSPKLGTCPDCGKTVSIHADFCPNCGARFKRKHGVFYYVFWGVISLFATGLILLVGLVFGTTFFSGFLEGRHNAQQQSQASSSENSGGTSPATPPTNGATRIGATTPASPPARALTDQEKLRAQQIIRTLSVDHDEVRGITWYKPKFTDDLGNQIYLYVGKRSDKPPILRLSIRYYDDDWLFVRSYTIKADDKTFELVPDDPPKHDNAGGKVWEWSDELATPHMNMLDAIIKSRKTILRYNGSKYYHDEIVSDTQRQWLDAMILVNRYLAAN